MLEAGSIACGQRLVEGRVLHDDLVLILWKFDFLSPGKSLNLDQWIADICTEDAKSVHPLAMGLTAF